MSATLPTPTLPFPTEPDEREPVDVAIVGAGAAGLSASINASSDGLSTLLLESDNVTGGQIRHSSLVENLLGYPAGVTGQQLIHRAERQALKFGVTLLKSAKVSTISTDGAHKVIHLEDGRDFVTKSVVIASGLDWKRLNAEGELPLIGKGVYYGADSALALKHRGKVVFIVGAANSSGQAAQHWSRFAKHVYIACRGESITQGMSDYLVERIQRNPNITVLNNTQITRVHGREELEQVTVTGKDWEDTLPASAVLVFIGSEPRTSQFKQCGIDCVETGHIETDKNYCTSVPGVFAIGDVRNSVAKRVSAALGDGASVIGCVNRYLKGIPLPV